MYAKLPFTWDYIFPGHLHVLSKPSICFWKQVISIKWRGSGTSCLFATLIWLVIERAHVVYGSCFSWRYESLPRSGIGGSRLLDYPQTFASSFISCSLQWPSWLHYECVRISALKYCQYHTGMTCNFFSSCGTTAISCPLSYHVYCVVIPRQYK